MISEPIESFYFRRIGIFLKDIKKDILVTPIFLGISVGVIFPLESLLRPDGNEGNNQILVR